MFDSHAHVMFPTLDADRVAVIERARKAGLFGWLEVGTDMAQSRKAVELASKEEGVYATVGVHPSDIAELNEDVWAEIAGLMSNQRVKAIGEVGFDFYRGGKEVEQVPVLRRFLKLAHDKNLPVVFHVRDGKDVSAHEALLRLLSEYSPNTRPKGVMHTYSGSVEQAKQYLELGMHLSFSGVVTFKNAGELLEVAKMVPKDRFLIETDCPFLAPEPYRGKRNEPAYVRLVAQKLADIRGATVDDIEKQTDANARQLFNL